MRVAIVHDFLNQRGGAERVVVSLSRMYPKAPIFTSVFDATATHEEFTGKDIRTSFLQKLPHSSKSFRTLFPIYPLAFRSFDLSGFDLVISSSTNFAHRVNPAEAKHVVYCHNPPRWLYQTDEYLSESGPAPAWVRPLINPVLGVMRREDIRSALKPDLYMANSRVVAGRIKQIYGREAPIVNPAVDLGRFTRAFETRQKGGEKSHYLVVSRLLGYKRIDLAVWACTRREVPLVVVGEGPALRDLKAIAGPSVRFAGKVTDSEMLELYSGAKALIHPAFEDFGIVLLEAAAAGIPSVTLRNGGALETVIEGETGIYFSDQRGESLMQALDLAEGTTWDAQAIRKHAALFDESVFEKHFIEALEAAGLNGGAD